MSASVTETLRLFYIVNRQPLYTYALSITHDRESAEDAIHQAFLSLLKRTALPNDVRPYIFRCVRNAVIDALRRTKSRQHSIFEDCHSLENERSQKEPELSPAELKMWLAHLSPEEQETIVLKVYDALTFQEIANLHEVPLPTVTSRYRRGMEKLRSLLTNQAP